MISFKPYPPYPTSPSSVCIFFEKAFAFRARGESDESQSPKGILLLLPGGESWDLSLDLWDFCNSDALSSLVFGKGALSFQRAARETACDLAELWDAVGNGKDQL